METTQQKYNCMTRSRLIGSWYDAIHCLNTLVDKCNLQMQVLFSDSKTMVIRVLNYACNSFIKLTQVYSFYEQEFQCKDKPSIY